MEHRIQLADLYAAPGFFDPAAGEASTLDAVRAAQLFSFLPNGTTFEVGESVLAITGPILTKKQLDEASGIFDRAATRAREGDHEKAIQLYERGLAIAALQTTARRDLAMSRMAKGDKEGAEAELRRLLLLSPADAWAWVILGNQTFRQNFSLAERYFRRAIELAPTDAYAWNGMGVMFAEKGDFAQAAASFETALKANPRFANAHFGLAVALADAGEPLRGFDTLERMFRTAVVQDSRAMPTFERAGMYYRDLAKRLARESMEPAEAEIETLAKEAERISGYPVVFEDGDFDVGITGSTELAWKHGRDHHVIRVRGTLDPVVKLHMSAHELCHIIMEGEARNAGTNRWFMTNETGFKRAQQEIVNELGPIRRSMAPKVGEELVERLFKGLMAQLFNLPLDMIIEHRIATRHRALRFAQIQGISLLMEEAVKGCSDPEIVRLTPRRILHASRFLNACYAAFIDQQFAGALSASRAFIEIGAMERGLKLFRLWEEATRELRPGGEYDLVDRFGIELRLQGWFTWQQDTGDAAPARGPEGSTNPDLLAAKSPAAFFYFLEILKRLDTIPVERIKHVGAEAAMAGQSGLNYASPDKNYSVPTYGPEKLSRLEVMCIMFAAFQRVAPQHDIGIELHEPYMKALALHEAKKGNTS